MGVTFLGNFFRVFRFSKGSFFNIMYSCGPSKSSLYALYISVKIANIQGLHINWNLRMIPRLIRDRPIKRTVFTILTPEGFGWVGGLE